MLIILHETNPETFWLTHVYSTAKLYFTEVLYSALYTSI